MKKMILALVALMTMTAAQAQDDNRPTRGERRQFNQTEMVKHRTDEVAKKYGLDSEQTAKLLELNKKYAGKMGHRMGGPRGRRPGARPGNPESGQQQGQRPELTEEQKQKMEAERKAHQEAMEQYDKELQSIMTSEQYKAYKEDMEKRRQDGGRRGGQRRDKKE